MLLHDCLCPRNRSIRTWKPPPLLLGNAARYALGGGDEQQVLEDFAGEFRIRLPADPGDHQVDNGRRAGAGDPATAANVEMSYRAGLRIVFLKADDVVPNARRHRVR